MVHGIKVHRDNGVGWLVAIQTLGPQSVDNVLCRNFNVFWVIKAGNLSLLDCLHPEGNRLPVGLRNIPVRTEIEQGFLADFCALALPHDQPIGEVGFSVRPVGRFGASKKNA